MAPIWRLLTPTSQISKIAARTRRPSPAGTGRGRSRLSTTTSKRRARTSCSAAPTRPSPILCPRISRCGSNHFFKPLAWKPGASELQPTPARCNGLAWTVKNLLELKNARRVLLDGNILEQNWEHAQNGFAILFTVRNQDGGCPWCTVKDVTFTNNLVRHTASGVNLLGTDWPHPSGSTERVLIRNNLFEDVDAATWGGHGRLFQLLDGTRNVTIEHNTAFLSGQGVLFADGSPHRGFTFRNNISAFGQYGVIGTGTAPGTATLTTYFPGALFQRNVLAGGDAATYANSFPADNLLYASLNNVGFVNRAGRDYCLAASSRYKHVGTDGKDIGVDFAALHAAMASSDNRRSDRPSEFRYSQDNHKKLQIESQCATASERSPEKPKHKRPGH